MFPTHATWTSPPYINSYNYLITYYRSVQYIKLLKPPFCRQPFQMHISGCKIYRRQPDDIPVWDQMVSPAIDTNVANRPQWVMFRVYTHLSLLGKIVGMLLILFGLQETWQASLGVHCRWYDIHISMVKDKSAVSQLLTYWRSHSLVPNHRFGRVQTDYSFNDEFIIFTNFVRFGNWSATVLTWVSSYVSSDLITEVNGKQKCQRAVRQSTFIMRR